MASKDGSFARRQRLSSKAYELSDVAFAMPPGDYDADLKAERAHRSAARAFRKAGNAAAAARHETHADRHEQRVRERMMEHSRRYARFKAGLL